MDANWGLDLDMSAVRLLRRDGEDWVEQAVEKIDSPDIEDRLERLISPIEDGGPVTLFLPRDQILYTTFELDASVEPDTQIERAMDGRTPYGLEDLSIDWETGEENTVRVAAIARDTLDEAAAFAEIRNLKIAGYSTLFSGDDFPRYPRFDGPSLAEGTDKPVEPATFATARVPSRPPDFSVAAASAAASAKARFTPQPAEPAPPEQPAHTERPEPEIAKPVLEVEDTTPVVQVKPPQLPLDPGLPISAPNAPPRVRSDIGAASVSGHAASLTPPGSSIRLRQNRAPISTLAVFAVAFLLTVGVAVLVYNYLPMRPESTVEAPVDTGALPLPVVEDGQSEVATRQAALESAEPGIVEAPVTETVGNEEPLEDMEIAALPDVDLSPPTTEPELAPEETAAVEPTPPEVVLVPLEATIAAPLSDTGVSAPRAPEPDAQMMVASLAPSETPKFGSAPSMTKLQKGTLPEVERSAPAAPLPKMTAELQTSAPFMGPEPDTDDTSDNIYVSAFELPDPATDAIALPAVEDLASGDLPIVQNENVASVEPAPAPPPADPVASAVELALTDALVGPGGLIQTELARSVPDRAPRARPDGFTSDIERQRYGGRTRAELARLRPPARPESAQALAEATESEPSALAVAQSILPRSRPGDFDARVATARAQAEAARVTASAAASTPDTSRAIEAALANDGEPSNRAVRPRSLTIPSSASVARQATIENAIRLNRINLVGVYGAPSDRRALVRLSSGRYVKVKVGDRVDGGTVAQITDSELYYRKGNRTLSLQVPQG